jgi:hypothetical protein
MNNKFIIGAVAGVTIIGGAVFAFMGKGGMTDGNGITSLPGVALAIPCPYDDKDLCKFMMNQKEMKEYTVKNTMTAKGMKPTENFVEMEGENMHMVAREDGKEVMASITIDDVDYMKDMEDGKWWKFSREKIEPGTLPDASEFDFDYDKSDVPEDKTTYKLIGKEACGNFQCFKYEIVDPANTDSKEFIWFDDKEYLLRKTRSESTGSNGMISEMVMSYVAVNIQAPTPVKEGSMFEASAKASGMSPDEIKQMEASMKQIEDGAQ